MRWLPPLRGLPGPFWILLGGTLINRLGAFVIPFLAIYLTEQRGFTPTQAGLSASLFGLGTFFAAILGGELSDRVGRRFTVVGSLLLGSLCLVWLYFARSYETILFAALLLGLWGDLYRPAVGAIMTDIIPVEGRTSAFGLMHWVINVGFSGSMLLAGFFADRHFGVLFFADAATTLLFAGLVRSLVPETRPGARTAIRVRTKSPWSASKVWRFFVFSTLVGVVFQQAHVALALDMRAHGLTPRWYGSLMAINGVLIVLFQPVLSNLSNRFGRSDVLVLSSVLTAFGFFTYALWPAPPGYALGIVLWTLGEILISPVLGAVLADWADTESRGRYQSVLYVSSGISTVAAPTFGSSILARGGGALLWTLCLGLGLLAALGYRSMQKAIETRTAPH